MGTSGKFRRTRQGFTLVELLTVIVIIGILASLITAAAINARAMVKRKVVLSEIGQIDIGLGRYKTEFGEYPPDFANVNQDNDPTVDLPGEVAAQTRVIRHLRTRFPKYRPIGDSVNLGNPFNRTPFLRFCFDVAYKRDPSNPAGPAIPNYGVNPSTFDAASALVFWLGGLPDTAPADPWIPRGFHSDPKFPFKQGSPRTDSFYEFDPERLVVIDPTTTPPKYLRYIPRYIEDAPLVYFKAVKSAVNGKYEYGAVALTAADPDFFLLYHADPKYGVSVPYLKKVPVQNPSTLVWERSWERPEKYQIICAGMDSQFGNHLPFDAGTPTRANFRVTSTGFGFSVDEGDYDNLTSFSTAKLEDGIE